MSAEAIVVAGDTLISIPRGAAHYITPGDQYELRASVRAEGQRYGRDLNFDPTLSVLAEILSDDPNWGIRKVSHKVKVEVHNDTVHFIEVGPVVARE